MLVLSFRLWRSLDTESLVRSKSAQSDAAAEQSPLLLALGQSHTVRRGNGNGNSEVEIKTVQHDTAKDRTQLVRPDSGLYSSILGMRLFFSFGSLGPTTNPEESSVSSDRGISLSVALTKSGNFTF